MKIVLISTYEMNRQPFGLASPAAWLRRCGHGVATVDLGCEPLPADVIACTDAIALHLPMHTATRLALRILPRLRELNPRARICAYGLYAPLNADLLRESGVETVIGGEPEQALCDWAAGASGDLSSLERLAFLKPDRQTLPPLSRYAKLITPEGSKIAGYTEATRGCKHLCRHCPIVPVYNGAFRVVQREAVLADIRQQVAAGAEHISFGDPDFFNGIGHALPIVKALHEEFPDVTYDATIKVEHLLRYREHLPALRETGCRFVVSAVESIDDAVLERLDKGHTRADFFRAVELMRDNGLTLTPTFVTFTPWITREDYRELLRVIADLGLVNHVASIQFAIRLLLPAGSRLMELDEMKLLVDGYDPQRLSWTWRHRDPSMDQLCLEIQHFLRNHPKLSRAEAFAEIWRLATGSAPDFALPDRSTVPYLNEPWYC